MVCRKTCRLSSFLVMLFFTVFKWSVSQLPGSFFRMVYYWSSLLSSSAQPLHSTAPTFPPGSFLFSISLLLLSFCSYIISLIYSIAYPHPLVVLWASLERLPWTSSLPGISWISLSLGPVAGGRLHSVHRVMCAPDSSWARWPWLGVCTHEQAVISSRLYRLTSVREDSPCRQGNVRLGRAPGPRQCGGVSAHVTGVHSIYNRVVLCKCCRGSPETARAEGVFSSTFGCKSVRSGQAAAVTVSAVPSQLPLPCHLPVSGRSDPESEPLCGAPKGWGGWSLTPILFPWRGTPASSLMALSDAGLGVRKGHAKWSQSSSSGSSMLAKFRKWAPVLSQGAFIHGYLFNCWSSWGMEAGVSYTAILLISYAQNHNFAIFARIVCKRVSYCSSISSLTEREVFREKLIPSLRATEGLGEARAPKPSPRPLSLGTRPTNPGWLHRWKMPLIPTR